MISKYGLMLFHPPGKMGNAESWWAVSTACGLKRSNLSGLFFGYV